MAVGKGLGQSQFQGQFQNHKSWSCARAVQAKRWNSRGIEVFKMNFLLLGGGERERGDNCVLCLFPGWRGLCGFIDECNG
jgi:hypothetical protein